ncbi:unnamed protein product [Schistosoma margrebowiei]|uniref:Uncharacterized protein n=1 Tax=Schistosoma margrebowiei TaxID=48269 RepID=A0A3P8CFD5_9TREM|nr:unnamed protein product [Schistosoma margrebowiei]
MGLVSWMYLHLIVDVHSGTRIQYHSLQTLSRYPFSYGVLIATCLCNWMKFKFTLYCLACIFPK